MVLDARKGEKGMMAAATTPPDAAATTEDTMGSSQTAATLSKVWFCRVNLNISCDHIIQRRDIHGKEHSQIDQYRKKSHNPPKAECELGPLIPPCWYTDVRNHVLLISCTPSGDPEALTTMVAKPIGKAPQNIPAIGCAIVAVKSPLNRVYRPRFPAMSSRRTNVLRTKMTVPSMRNHAAGYGKL
jgi:hypothetical protein